MRLGPSISSGTEPLFLYLWKYAVIILRSGCYFALIHARFYILSSFAGEVSAGRISVPTVSVSPLTVNGRSSLPYTRRNILPSSAWRYPARIVLERRRQTVYITVRYLRTRLGRYAYAQPMQLCLRGVALARVGAAVAYRDIGLYVVYRRSVGHVDAGDEQRQRTGCAVTAWEEGAARFITFSSAADTQQPYAGQSERIRTVGRAGGKYPHPAIAAERAAGVQSGSMSRYAPRKNPISAIGEKNPLSRAAPRHEHIFVVGASARRAAPPLESSDAGARTFRERGCVYARDGANGSVHLSAPLLVLCAPSRGVFSSCASVRHRFAFLSRVSALALIIAEKYDKIKHRAYNAIRITEHTRIASARMA